MHKGEDAKPLARAGLLVAALASATMGLGGFVRPSAARQTQRKHEEQTALKQQAGNPPLSPH